MKIIYAAFLLTLLALSGYSQNSNSSSDTPTLVVLKQEWHFELRNPALDESPFLELDARLKEEREQINSTTENQRRASTTDNPKDLPPSPVNRPLVRRKNSRFTPSYTYKIKVENNGEKAIRSVMLDYIFLEPNTKRELGRRRFTGDRKISSGKTKDFIFRSNMPPTAAVNATTANKKLSFEEKVVVRKIEYADGSVWRDESSN